MSGLLLSFITNFGGFFFGWDIYEFILDEVFRRVALEAKVECLFKLA